MQQPDQTEKLLQDLQSTQAYMRLAAAFELGRQRPAEPRTLRALSATAATDTNTDVRNAAATSYVNLTSAETAQASSESTHPMTWAVPTSSQPSGNSVGMFILAVVLSSVANVFYGLAVIAVCYRIFGGYSGYNDNVVDLVILATNLILLIYLIRIRQYAAAIGLVVGLVCDIALVADVARALAPLAGI